MDDSVLKNREGVSVHAGFPNAADDSRLQGLNLNSLLIKNPVSTFHFRVKGNQWQDIGIFDGDIALVDRALVPRKNDLVIWWHDGEFAISLCARIPRQAVAWGVVTTIIHQYGEGARDVRAD